MKPISRALLLLPCLGTIAACAKPSSEHHDHRAEQSSQWLSAGSLFGTGLPDKTLSLTFDDGPGERTAELSSFLKSQGIRATFYVNGARIAATRLPDNALELTGNARAILAQMQADGHLVANHGTTHRNLTKIPGDQLLTELAETDTAIQGYISPPSARLFRAPFGAWSAEAHATLANSSMNKYIGPVNWEVGGNADGYPGAAADWACWQGQARTNAGALVNGNGYATSAECGDGYIAEIRTKRRGIVLFHDPYGWAQGSTVDMVKYMVPRLKGEGYKFVRNDEVPGIATELRCDGACATCSGPLNTQCTSCADGRFLADGQCRTCSTCPGGKAPAVACGKNSDAVCSECTACPPGSSQSRACTASAAATCDTCDANEVSSGGGAACTTCPAGSAPNENNSSCELCSAGRFAVAAQAMCADCGNCDDNDSCTVDSCNRTLGCTHLIAAACGGPPPAAGPVSPPSAPPVSNPNSTPTAASPEATPAVPAVPSGQSSADPNTTPPEAPGCSATEKRSSAGVPWLLLGLTALLSRRRSRR